MRSIITLYLLFLLPSIIFAQENKTILFDDVKTALADPVKVEHMYLDCSSDDDSLLFSKIDKFLNLKSITIVSYQGKSLPEAFFNRQSINCISVSEMIDFDFDLFFSQVMHLPNLKQLNIDECELTTLNPSLKKMKNLEELSITNCINIDFVQAMAVIAEMPMLKKLSLPVDDLCSLPANIFGLKKLESLDISNIVGYEMPKELSAALKINADKKDMVEIQNAARKITIVFTGFMENYDGKLPDCLQKLFSDCSISLKNNLTLPSDTNNRDNNIIYGEFTEFNAPDYILSEAYLHYARLFNFGINFDSTMFDERYTSHKYTNTFPVNTSQRASSINHHLYLWKGQVSKDLRKNIVFNFRPESGAYPYSIINFNREIMRFQGMYWILDEPISKKKFRKKYCRGIKRNDNIGNAWNDIRIYYDDDEKMFTIEMKNVNEYSRFKAHPVLATSGDPEQSKKEYISRYLSYSKTLQSRRKKFNAQMIKNKQKSYNQRIKNFNAMWKEFSANYFSVEEKKMSQKQWLEYYDKIIASEKSAFSGTSVSVELLQRYLEICDVVYENAVYTNDPMAMINIRNNQLLGQLLFDSLRSVYPVDFVDKLENKLVIQHVFVINNVRKIYYRQLGSLGVEQQLIWLAPSNDIVFIVILRNGKIGIARNAEWASCKADIAKINKIHVDLYEAKLFTFKQLAEETGIK